MNHPAQSSSRIDPEARVNVRALGGFLIQDLAPTGGLESRVTVVGERVRVPCWLARDLAARELAEII